MAGSGVLPGSLGGGSVKLGTWECGMHGARSAESGRWPSALFYGFHVLLTVWGQGRVRLRRRCDSGRSLLFLLRQPHPTDSNMRASCSGSGRMSRAAAHRLGAPQPLVMMYWYHCRLFPLFALIVFTLLPYRPVTDEDLMVTCIAAIPAPGCVVL